MIDKILNRMTKNLKLYETMYDEPFRFVLNKEETNILLDYINNRQQRIDKVIEYVEEHKEPLHHWFDEPDCDYWLATNPDDILNILKGSDSNE